MKKNYTIIILLIFYRDSPQHIKQNRNYSQKNAERRKYPTAFVDPCFTTNLSKMTVLLRKSYAGMQSIIPHVDFHNISSVFADFMEDKLMNNRKFRTLNIIDDYNREALNIVIDYSFPSTKVVEAIKQVIEWRGQPESIRSDHGSELTNKFTEDYNQNHVHKSLANMTSLEFLNHHSKKIPYFAVGF